MLDAGHTIRFESADQLKEAIINMLIDNERQIFPLDIGMIDWVNVISELVAMTYNIYLILLLDYDGDLRVQMVNSAQSALLQNCDETKFAIIGSHDNGIYPLVELPNKILFNCKDNKLLSSIKDIFDSEYKNIAYMGIHLEEIITFAQNNKDYKITTILKGKRGLVYGAILNRNIYVPCIYTEYVSGRYNIQQGFPDTNIFKRNALYKFIDSYNAFSIKKNKNNLKIINPVAVLRHKNKYVGLRLRFVYDRYGMTIHHTPESTIGRYDIKVIDVPYDISEINKAIGKKGETVVDNNVAYYAYQNYVYSLFLTEFAYDIRKFKNTKIRKALTETLSHATRFNVDRREIKSILNNHPTDYSVITEITSTNVPKKAISIIQQTIFDFDLIDLKRLRNMSYENRLKEIKHTMRKYVIFVPKTKKPGISNTLVSCTIDKNALQCSSGKLMMDETKFYLCCQYLAKDLEVPYIFETISTRITDTRNRLLFSRRKTEILRIRELD